ncbi:MAG: ATP-dependent helicase, partial [Pseudobutyrivibrio sp.]|nr:ATP-dependent helicase [Pseudobutyrivibrio sp.]
MSLISNNKIRFQKDIKSNKGAGNIHILEYEDEAKEAEGIITEILKLKENGKSFDETVILYRNHSDARYIVDRLIQQKIPFF